MLMWLRRLLDRLGLLPKQDVHYIGGSDTLPPPLKEVADQMGISQSYISRLEKRIIQRLKKEILRLS